MSYDLKYSALQSFLKDAAKSGSVLNCRLDAEYNTLKNEYERLVGNQSSSNESTQSKCLFDYSSDDTLITTIKGEFQDSNSNWRMVEVRKTKDGHFAQSLCPVMCTSFYDSKLNITKYFPFRGVFRLIDNKWVLTGDTCDVHWLEAVQNNIRHLYRQNYNVTIQSEYGVTGAAQWRINEIWNTGLCTMAGLTCITPGLSHHTGDTTIQPLIQLVVTDNNRKKAWHNVKPLTQLTSTK
ncbi:hypothetical protein [Nostoc sp. DedQUE07]|uniref:hypothetical protein n=1 Tax=Nostoc sp. DedQUE07 TaxID=3075392 RepID=UPI002AD51F3A|nr:hypothetical protein [Nostoc sp. DedQUE07]MDZ8132233.1 hypothetical protein [Nostoc sp. DedQUE07]